MGHAVPVNHFSGLNVRNQLSFLSNKIVPFGLGKLKMYLDRACWQRMFRDMNQLQFYFTRFICPYFFSLTDLNAKFTLYVHSGRNWSIILNQISRPMVKFEHSRYEETLLYLFYIFYQLPNAAPYQTVSILTISSSNIWHGSV